MDFEKSTGPSKRVQFKENNMAELVHNERARLNPDAGVFQPSETHPTIYTPDANLVLLTELLQNNDISEGMGELLEHIIRTLPNSFSSGRIERPPHIKLASFPAHQSQPTQEELGITSYLDYAEETKNYGFDTGFIRQVMRNQFTPKNCITTVCNIPILSCRPLKNYGREFCEEQKRKSRHNTIRFSVPLIEPTESTCP